MSMARAVPAALALCVVALLGIGVWLLSATPGTLVNEPPPLLGPTRAPGGETVVVTIDDGDSVEEIGEKLEQAGVIQSARLFRVLATLMGTGNDLAPGDYEFEHGETALTAVRRISQGITAQLVVTIPEGLRIEEYGAILEGRSVVPAADFRAALGEQYQAAFLSELPPGASLEGFLFPATYGFARGTTAHQAVQQLVDAFDQRYRDEVLPRLAASGRLLYDIVTLASIIEREAKVPEERALIASVFWNRIDEGLPLQADPTVQYVVASDPANVALYGYWKAELSLADLAMASPYNTYVSVGLPPGPIASPGIDSMLAALEPAETNFLFFVAGPDGSHLFAETLEEHNTNVCSVYPERC